ncbi:MAG: metal-sulfur cluster assembly factor [Nanoarchaeota archaeon]|nr:metal-sulfur cluster assembly factor [Nanoarchaeota archaeon]
MLTKEDIIEVCKNYQDPELGIDIWTLGLIYDIKIEKDNVHIKLTFTSPSCPFGPQMMSDLKRLIKEKGAKKVEIELTFSPAWTPSEELKEALGLN